MDWPQNREGAEKKSEGQPPLGVLTTCLSSKTLTNPFNLAKTNASEDAPTIS